MTKKAGIARMDTGVQNLNEILQGGWPWGSVVVLAWETMFSTESVTDRDFSPIADNLLMLRYVSVDGGIKPSLTVVKTRGSKHERDTHFFEMNRRAAPRR